MIRFFSKGVTLDSHTTAYIEKRMERIEKLVDPVSKFEVEITMDKKGKFRVELMVQTPHNLYRAEETTMSVEGSIDTVVDKIEEEIAKQKGKHHDLIVRGARSIKKKLVIDGSARF